VELVPAAAGASKYAIANCIDKSTAAAPAAGLQRELSFRLKFRTISDPHLPGSIKIIYALTTWPF